MIVVHTSESLNKIAQDPPSFGDLAHQVGRHSSTSSHSRQKGVPGKGAKSGGDVTDFEKLFPELTLQILREAEVSGCEWVAVSRDLDIKVSALTFSLTEHGLA